MIENILYQFYHSSINDLFNHFQQSPSLALMANQTDQLVMLINLVTIILICQTKNFLSLSLHIHSISPSFVDTNWILCSAFPSLLLYHFSICLILCSCVLINFSFLPLIYYWLVSHKSPSLTLMANQTDQLVKLINLVSTKLMC